MMTKQKSLIGMEIDSTLRDIERGQLHQLANAFEKPYSPNKEHQNSPKKDSDIYLPSFMFGNLANFSNIYKNLNLNISNILLSRESVICHAAIKAGDSVKVKTVLKDAYEQQASSNPIGFIVLEIIGHLEEEIAFYCERVIAVRGGFQRRHP